jgi:hypothetical protein
VRLRQLSEIVPYLRTETSRNNHRTEVLAAAATVTKIASISSSILRIQIPATAAVL